MALRARPGKPLAATIVALALMPVLLLTACGSSSTKTSTPKPTASPVPHIILVTDGPASDPYWTLVQRGANQAAKETGVKVTYATPASAGTAALAQVIDAAVTSQPSGLILSLPDCSGLAPSIQRALLVGLPIIAIGAGSDCAAKLGVLSYVGQNDYQAGLQGGQRMASAGARHVLCVAPQTDDSAFADRCRGVHDALKKVHGVSTVLPLDVSNASDAQQKLASLLAQDPTIDGMITMNADAAVPAAAAVQHLVRTSQFSLASFDLSAPVLQAIQQGAMMFAIDQQPYLQGYLPVVLLSLYSKNLNSVINPVISTGPTFVTSSNVAQIQQLVAAGTR